MRRDGRNWRDLADGSESERPHEERLQDSDAARNPLR